MARGRSIAFDIAAQLRQEIVSLRRPPGSAIIEQQIAEAHGVSRTPVREAVLRLADEGLIEVFPQSGTFVSRIPADELGEAIAIRRALEEATVRVAARLAAPGDIARLQTQLAGQQAIAEAGDQAAFHRADELFHATLAEIAQQKRFWQLVLQVKMQVDRFRLLTLPVPGRMRAVVAEHSAIVAAIAAGSADAAAAAIASHLDFLLGAVAGARLAHPELFETVPRRESAYARSCRLNAVQGLTT